MKEEGSINPDQSQPEVTYIVESGQQKQNVKTVYPHTLVTVLGSLQICCAVVVLTLEISAILVQKGKEKEYVQSLYYIAFVCTPAVIFFISGVLTISGSFRNRNGNKGLLVVTMVMTIISAILAGFLSIMSGMIALSANMKNFNFPHFSPFLSLFIPQK